MLSGVFWGVQRLECDLGQKEPRRATNLKPSCLKVKKGAYHLKQQLGLNFCPLFDHDVMSEGVTVWEKRCGGRALHPLRSSALVIPHHHHHHHHHTMSPTAQGASNVALVTGATGLVGRYLVAHLLKLGTWKVYAVSRAATLNLQDEGVDEEGGKKQPNNNLVHVQVGRRRDGDARLAPAGRLSSTHYWGQLLWVCSVDSNTLSHSYICNPALSPPLHTHTHTHSHVSPSPAHLSHTRLRQVPSLTDKKVVCEGFKDLSVTHIFHCAFHTHKVREACPFTRDG